jgi:hypothetical protein
MSYDEAPSCERHESSVPMELRSMHSDATEPEQLLGLFECPECGHERRLPLRSKEAAA